MIKIHDFCAPVRYTIHAAGQQFEIDADYLGDAWDILIDYFHDHKCWQHVFVLDFDTVREFPEEYLSGGNYGEQTNIAYHNVHVSEQPNPKY